MRQRSTRTALMLAGAMSMATSTHAAFNMTPDMGQCSGTLTIDTMTVPGQVHVQCDGSYTLANGTMTSDEAVMITGASVILNDTLRFDVPLLTIASGDTMIGSGASLAVQQAPILQTSTTPTSALVPPSPSAALRAERSPSQAV